MNSIILFGGISFTILHWPVGSISVVEMQANLKICELTWLRKTAGIA